MTWAGIGENIVSDILFTLILIGLAWLWTFFTQRRSLQRFFNVASSKRLIIYVSNLAVLPFGSVGPSGRKFSFQGQAVAYGEILGANQISNLFSFIIPKLAEVSERIGRFLLSDVQVEVLISPIKRADLRTDASLVSLGTPAYSTASEYMESIPNGIARFKLGSMSIAEVQAYPRDFRPTVASDSDAGLYDPNPPQYPMPSGTGGTATMGDGYDPTTNTLRVNLDYGEITPPALSGPSSITIDGIPAITDTTYALVERLQDPDHFRSLFYVAGLSELGTKGAAYYLASEWRTLHKKYGTKPFLVLLRINEKNYLKWSVVSERVLAD